MFSSAALQESFLEVSADSFLGEVSADSVNSVITGNRSLIFAAYIHIKVLFFLKIEAFHLMILQLTEV